MAATRISDATTITPVGTEYVPLGNGTSKVKATTLAISQLGTAYPLSGTGNALTGAVTISQSTFSTTITGTPTTGNFIFTPNLANLASYYPFVFTGSGTETMPFVMKHTRTDFNTVSDNVMIWGYNPDNEYDATKSGIAYRMEYHYAPSAPTDWFIENHLQWVWPSAFGSGSSRLFSSTLRVGASLAASSNEWDFRGTVINWMDLSGNVWAGMSPGSFQIGNTAGTLTTAFLSDSVASAFKIYPYAGTYTNGLDMSLWSTVALGGLTFTNGTIFAGSTGAITLTNNTVTNPIAVNTTAGFTFTGSGTQTFITGISSSTTRSYISTNFGTGEVRFFAGTGGYFQTFYANNAETFRLASDGSIQVGGRMHIALSTGTSPTGAYLDFGNSGTGTAYIRFPTGGSLLTTPAAGSVEYDGINLYFTPSGTTTRKVVNCTQIGRSTAQTGAVASVAAWTVGANDGAFRVSANVLVTASTTHVFTVTCTYTDEGNTSRTLTLNFQNVGGTISTSIANAGGAVPYEGLAVHIRCKAATTITIATTGTFTSVTYNVEGEITQLA